MRYYYGVRLTPGRCRWTWRGLLWRWLPHNRFALHVPFHPGNYEFWYCSWCHQGWLPKDDPDRWVPYKPGHLWNGSLDHWQPDVMYVHDPDGRVRAWAVRRPDA